MGSEMCIRDRCLVNIATTNIGLNTSGVLAFTGNNAVGSQNQSELRSSLVNWRISNTGNNDFSDLTLDNANVILQHISNAGNDHNSVILTPGTLVLRSLGDANRIDLTMNKLDAVFTNSTDDLFKIDQNGVITAPDMTNAEVTAAGNDVFITKGYADATYSGGTAPTGLEKISEGTSSGFAKIGEDRANKGDIGDESFDLAQSFTPSNTLGATGDNSFSIGVETTASSSSTFAGGAQSNATASFAFSYGSANTSSGNSSVTMGQGNNSPTIAEMTIGRYATTYTPAGSSTSHNNADRIFTVGNGTTSALRSDALIVTKGGVVTAPSLDVAEITGDHDLITKEYSEANYIKSLTHTLTNHNITTTPVEILPAPGANKVYYICLLYTSPSPRDS